MPNGACARAAWRCGATSRPRFSTGRPRLVKPGGRIVYITCSVLPEENDDALAAFMERTRSFGLSEGTRDERGSAALKDCRASDSHGLQLTPHKTGTDGFYAAILEGLALGGPQKKRGETP